MPQCNWRFFVSQDFSIRSDNTRGVGSDDLYGCIQKAKFCQCDCSGNGLYSGYSRGTPAWVERRAWTETNHSFILLYLQLTYFKKQLQVSQRKYKILNQICRTNHHFSLVLDALLKRKIKLILTRMKIPKTSWRRQTFLINSNTLWHDLLVNF